MKTIAVFAPATVANLACGFDIFGAALENPGDEIYLKLRDKQGVVITKIEGDGGRLPLDPKKNTAGVSALCLLKHTQSKYGVEICIRKKMPLGSGLGSSASSAAGSVFGLNALLGNPLATADLIPFAMEGERIACGCAHADNVAPCLLGGFVLIRSYGPPLDIVKVPLPFDLYFTILHQKIIIKTRQARKMLEDTISIKQHIIQTGNAVGLVLGLMKGDVDLIRNSLQDVIAEPIRSVLIPQFAEIKKAALDANALGCSISGSGPSMFALSLTHSSAVEIGKAMQKASEMGPCKSDLYISQINTQGPRILCL